MVYDKMGTRGVTLTVLILPTEIYEQEVTHTEFRQQGKFTNQVRIPAALVTHHHAPCHEYNVKVKSPIR